MKNTPNTNENSSSTVILYSMGNFFIESDITENAFNRSFSDLYGIPKALLPIGGKPCLNWWYDQIKFQGSHCIIVTDSKNYKSFERWAILNEFPLEDILNIGFTDFCNESYSESFVKGLDMVFRLKSHLMHSSIIITDASFLYDEDTYCQLNLFGNNTTCLIDSYQEEQLRNSPTTSSFFCIENELPLIVVISQTMREPVINYFKQKSLEFNTKKVENVNEYKHFLKFLFHKTTVQPIKPPKGIVWDWLKLNLSAEKYLSIYQNLTWSKANFSETESFKTGKRSVAKVYARVGLLGNPSDGFFGKTLSMLISNFWAQVSLFPNETEDIIFLSNSLLDPTKFSSIHGISGVVNKDGYSGALILFFAMTKIFTNYCKNNSISLKKCGFKVIYETNIPRQVGLAGSSALIIAFLKALLKFYEIDDSVIPLHVQANLALNAEKLELSISSGHQDRVIQTYGGVVYMDFRESLMKERGWGEYEKLEDNVSFEVFDGLWLAYVGQPKNSGLVHNKVRSKFENGDKEVIAAMEEFGSFAKGGLQALKNRNRKEFALLMEKNFNLRRKIYGDDVIGERSLKMIEIGKKYGFAVKFSGSGGACIGLWKGDGILGVKEVNCMTLVRNEMESEGFIFCMLKSFSY